MKLFILMLAISAGDADVENASMLWVIEGEEQCGVVASILNANSDGAWIFCQPDATRNTTS